MRTAMSVLLGVLLCAGAAAAQAPVFGVKGGVNGFTLSGGDGSARSNTGLAVGAFLSAPIGSIWAVEPDILFSQKGAGFTDGGISGSLTLNYLSVPVLLKLGIPLAGVATVRPYLVAGPEVSFKLGCRVEGSSGSVTAGVDCDDSAFGGELDMKSTDFGGVFGAGIGVPAGVALLTLDARYELGLMSIGKSGGDAKNRGFTFMLGVGLPLRK